MIKSILINPFDQTILDVTLVDSKLQTIKNLIDCEIITVVSLSDKIDMILDDEGLLKASESQAYFKVGIGSQPFAGKGLIISKDDEGETVSLPKNMTAEKISEKIIFFKPAEDYLAESRRMILTSF